MDRHLILKDKHVRTMRQLIRFFVLGLIAGTAGQALAGQLNYEATLEDSSWETSSSPLRCTLKHPVKFFGQAEFYQLAGYRQKFRFFINQSPVRKGKVTLVSMPPEWKHNRKSRNLGKYSYRRGETPFRFNRKLSLRLLSELEQGMRPVFKFKDWGDGHDDVSAVLSTVRFRDALAKFRVCVGQIIPYDYNKVKKSMLYFNSGRYKLTVKAKRKLEGMIAYLIRDHSVKKVYVAGHTDNVGTHTDNNELSERRALAVRDYLISRKVPISKLNVKYFGKRKPARGNSTAKGRAKNRRVRVELERE
ncbi:MAG TPA: OmpA family protein [Gammaproteobacteria bacterium]|nr:OmpA family protein [Gammaproteobacteria bacterium]